MVTEQTAPAPEETQATAPAQASETPAEEPFDKERAMATIRKLRDEAKDAASLRKRVAEIEAAQKAASEKELSETERLRKQLSETEAAAKATQERLIAERRRTLVTTVAAAMHANDPQDANLIQATASIDPEAEGAEVEVRRLLGELAKAKPYLFRQAGGSAFNPPGSAGVETDKQRLDRLYRLTGQSTSPFG